ncbi:MAG: hypothetical protein WAQ08_18305 [Aquabacterium sp.]|uniref:hypothetical protein n=1 Tax=Aquabacterium sp. TaxID=1872578 RepID=UPI003BB013A1
MVITRPKFPEFSWIFVAAATAAVLFGGLLGLGFYILLIPLLALIFGACMIAFPNVALWTVIMGALGGIGLVELFAPQFRQLGWAVAALSMALGGVALIQRVAQAKRQALNQEGTGLLIWFVAFAFVGFASCVANKSLNAGTLSSLKGYFQAVGVLFAIVWFNYTNMELRRFMTVLMWLTLIQLPFVLHQFFFLVPIRSTLDYASRGIVAIDIVSGTFGGLMSGGGRSIDLAILCLIGATYAGAAWRIGALSGTRALLVVLVALIPIAVAEVKIVFFLIPVAVYILMRDLARKFPARFILGIASSFVLLIAIAIGYALLPGAESQKPKSFAAYIDDTISYNIGDRGYGNATLNRSTVYSFWFHENVINFNGIHALVGYGPGATFTNSSLSGKSVANEKYKAMGIGLTGLSSILWEFGLLGGIALAGIFISAYRLAAKLLKKIGRGPDFPAVVSAQVGVVACGISLFHSSYFVFDMAHQVMLMMFLGVIIGLARKHK